MKDYRLNFIDWVDEQTKRSKSKNSKPFVGSRNLHFDGKVYLKENIQTGDHYIVETMQDSELLAIHKYLPFIRKDNRERKYRNKPHAKDLSHNKRYPVIKNRRLMYASHKDACIYSFFNYMVGTKYENELHHRGLKDNVTAYRSIPINPNSNHGKSNIEISLEPFQILSQTEKSQAVLIVDIEHFFDNLDHSYLKESWLNITQNDSLPKEEDVLLKTLTEYRFTLRDEVYTALGFKRDERNRWKIPDKVKSEGMLCTPKEFSQYIKKAGLIKKNKSGRGIPQGSPISGLLANMYMLDFDTTMKQLIEDEFQGVYRRYSDDILVIVPENAVSEIYNNIEQQLYNNKLRLKQGKSDCFLWEPKKQKFANIVSNIESDSNNIAKQNPVYLGIEYGDGIHANIKSATVARRFRGSNKLKRKKWAYFKKAIKVTGSTKMTKQFNSIRKKIKTKNSLDLTE